MIVYFAYYDGNLVGVCKTRKIAEMVIDDYVSTDLQAIYKYRDWEIVPVKVIESRLDYTVI